MFELHCRSHPTPATVQVELPPVPAAVRRQARRVEIDRDERLVASALLYDLRRLLAVGDAEAPAQLWARIEVALRASREAQRRLNNLRIALRANRAQHYADSAPLPASLRPYRHRGNYHGAFGSMAELGNCLRAALGITDGLTPADRVHIARQLHLHGEIWTLDHEGAVHVFGKPGSAADLLLASERPQPCEPPHFATLEAPAS